MIQVKKRKHRRRSTPSLKGEVGRGLTTGLLPVEWMMVGYTVLTSLWILFAFTRMENPMGLLLGRFQILMGLLLLWAATRLWPSRWMVLARIAYQMVLLAWWYPDTYELNRILPNLDHVFAAAEQSVFHCQPALLFAQKFPQTLVSELMDMGYAAYYPIMVCVVLYYFFWRYRELQRAAWVLIGSFFVYYVVFDFLPVAGPTFYYHAVGVDEIARGVFPAMGDYFNTHTACLPSPGYEQGVFYQLVEQAKAAGERPTAAFPSSHVGVATICMLLVWHARNRRLLLALLPFYLFLCMATVYIQAHYAIDAIAGLITGVIIYFVLYNCPIVKKTQP